MIVPPVPQPPFWPQFWLQTWHDFLLIIGPGITAWWAVRSNRQHLRNEGKIDQAVQKIDELHQRVNGNGKDR